MAFFTFFLDVAVSLLPDEAPDVAEGELVPLAPEVLEGFGVLGGTDMDVPLPPAMPASLPVPAPVAPVAFCERTVGDGVVALLPAPEDCARTSDDADAIRTNEIALSWLVNVMCTSY
ncbi:hypothetical protein ASE07_00810 [Noviherbaspirillum sp. Root189]|nr:hypothetical protein ASE07_00810 [Noviherbaspirillum sp. Root189]